LKGSFEMEKKFNASLEIFYFEHDIITTSGDHDNGYFEGGTLPYSVKDIVNFVEKIFD
jgi:hypothetical protein